MLVLCYDVKDKGSEFACRVKRANRVIGRLKCRTMREVEAHAEGLREGIRIVNGETPVVRIEVR